MATLTRAHIEQSLKTILIGNGFTKNGARKYFSFGPITSKFTIDTGGKQIASGNFADIDALLQKYNDL